MLIIETLKYISKSNQFHQTFFDLESTKNKQSFDSYLKFGQLPYLTKVKTKKTFLSNSFNGFSLNFYELSSTLKTDRFWSNLDEIPAYLDSLPSLDTKKLNDDKILFSIKNQNFDSVYSNKKQVVKQNHNNNLVLKDLQNNEIPLNFISSNLQKLESLDKNNLKNFSY